MLLKNNYILVTSAYNEEQNISKCIESVLKQTILPTEWIIINNGSSDNTGEIVKNYSDKFPFIKLVFKEKVEFKISGYHAILNFYYGLNKLENNLYNFLGNLDADIVIDRPDYYEYQMEKMVADDKIGITTGVTYYFDLDGNKQLVWHNPWHTTGGLKFYKRECFESLGIMTPDFGWDGADEMKAMSRGWKTITFFHLEVNHLGKLRDLDRQKNREYHFNRGFSIFRRGYPYWYIIIKVLQTLKESSYSSSRALLEGYWSGLVSREPKILNQQEIRFLRKFHFLRLFKITS
jgi:glycosyltransferase involved in cell wall biosynthesis